MGSKTSVQAVKKKCCSSLLILIFQGYVSGLVNLALKRWEPAPLPPSTPQKTTPKPPKAFHIYGTIFIFKILYSLSRTCACFQAQKSSLKNIAKMSNCKHCAWTMISNCLQTYQVLASPKRLLLVKLHRGFGVFLNTTKLFSSSEK